MRSSTYRLTVAGELSDRMRPSFGGMALEQVGGNTTLTGVVRDQAELQGLLRRVSDLGLTLLEARALDDRLEGPTGAEPAASGHPPTSGERSRP